MNKSFTVHIDVDSPPTLANFYNIQLKDYTIEKLENFYALTFERAFEILERYGIKATFFCVASELESSDKIKAVLLRAIEKGHYIANHTYTHPFGLNELSDDEINHEIGKANAIFKERLNIVPIGFRSPGYAIDTAALNIVEAHGLKYDSSAGWPVFHVLFKLMRWLKSGKNKQQMQVGFGETNSRFRRAVYTPDKMNWKKNDKTGRPIREYPLAASFFFIPCYTNLHLYFPVTFTRFLLANTKRYRLMIYLMHIIEFASLEDDCVPQEIIVHPHVRTPISIKFPKIHSILNYINTHRNQMNIEKEYIN